MTGWTLTCTLCTEITVCLRTKWLFLTSQHPRKKQEVVLVLCARHNAHPLPDGPGGLRHGVAAVRRRHHAGAAPAPSHQRGLRQDVLPGPGRCLRESLSPAAAIGSRLTLPRVCVQDRLISGCSGIYCPLEEFKQALSSYSLSPELYKSLCEKTEGLTEP